MSSEISDFTPAQIPSLAGTDAIITGANSGIGFVTALELARHGAHVSLAVRSAQKGAAAVAQIRAEIPAASVEVLPLDLASLASVESFAKAYAATNRQLHLLINNAGIMALPKRTLTADGFEAQFGTNVLGHFALTARLFPAIVKAGQSGSGPSRIVTISSIIHKRGRIRLDDLTFTSGYKPMVAYGQSKLANLMFALELDRRLRAASLPVWSLAAHPGVAATNLFKGSHYPGYERIPRLLIGHVINAVLNTAAEGALPTLYASTSPDAKSGEYYGPTGFREMRGPLGRAHIAPQSKDEAIAAALWRRCEELTGLSFP